MPPTPLAGGASGQHAAPRIGYRGQRGRPDPQRGYDTDHKSAYAGGYPRPGHQPQLRSGGHEDDVEDAEDLMMDSDLADSELAYHYL